MSWVGLRSKRGALFCFSRPAAEHFGADVAVVDRFESRRRDGVLGRFQGRARAGTWERWRPRGLRAGSIGVCCDGDGPAGEPRPPRSVLNKERRPLQGPGASLRLESVSCKCSAVPGRTVGCPAAQRLRLRRGRLRASRADRRRFVLCESPDANFGSERARTLGPLRALGRFDWCLLLAPCLYVVSALARGLPPVVAASVLPWCCKARSLYGVYGEEPGQPHASVAMMA